MSLRPGATVVVPSMGGAKKLPVLIGSLAKQDTDDFEVVVVVDGDIDDSESVVARLATEVPFRLRSVVFPENRGRVAALNAGAEVAEREILIRCDDDLGLPAQHIRRHLERHAAGERGVIVPARDVFPDNPYAWAYGRHADLEIRAAMIATPPEQRWRFWSGYVSVPKVTHDRIGGYDSRYRHYGWEDVDFGYRLHRDGVPIDMAGDMVGEHYGVDRLENRALRALHSGSARSTFAEIHGSEALGEVPKPGGAWGALVRGGAAIASERNVGMTARLLDRHARVLPHWVARKAMSFVVESAGYAGSTRPELAQSNF